MHVHGHTYKVLIAASFMELSSIQRCVLIAVKSKVFINWILSGGVVSVPRPHPQGKGSGRFRAISWASSLKKIRRIRFRDDQKHALDIHVGKLL